MSRARTSHGITDLAPGDHLCWFYDTEEEHRAVITPFLRQGLERGEKVLYSVDARTAEAVLAYSRADGLEVEPYLARGQLCILTRDDAYMRQGVFDPDGMVALLRAETARASAEGYTALRISGEMTWGLRGLPGSGRLIEYDAKPNNFFPGSQCLGLCQYDRRRFGPALLLEVLATHPTAMVGTAVYDNFYYLPPQEILGADRPAATLRHCLENLKQRSRAKQALRESEERFRRFFERAPLGYQSLDAEGCFIDVNQAWLDLRGYSCDQVIGRIIVRVDSPIKRITDLRGKTIFFLPPSGMSGHLKPKVPLLDHGLVAGHFVCEPLLGIPRPVRRELGFSVLTTGWDLRGLESCLFGSKN